MDIIPFKGKYPSAISYLVQVGILQGYPQQVDRSDLQYADGVDIAFKFKNLGPEKFRHYVDAILLAACETAKRYENERYKFGRFTIVLNRNKLGEKQLNPTRDYTSAKHSESETMVYGEEALGYKVPESSKTFLINKAEAILDITNDVSVGPYINSRAPYKVLQMTVSIRSDTYSRQRSLKKLEDTGGEKVITTDLTKREE